MPTILGANTLSASYDVENSLRLNDGDTPYLTRTISSGADVTQFTFSFWCKRCTLGGDQRIYSNENTTAKQIYIRFNNNNTFTTYHQGGGSDVLSFDTNAIFRDTSGWYHFHFLMDSTQGTESDRFKMHVNGQQITSFNSPVYPSSNEAAAFLNTNEKQNIGYRDGGGDQHFDGYLAEMVLLQGVAEPYTTFGEFDSDSPNIWKPKKLSGLTFGTNGFHLEYKQTGTSANSSGIGADTSGNDNHFTPNNLAAIDITEDTCTNNFAVINNLNVNAGGVPTFAEGNLDVTVNGASGTQWGGASTLGVTTGKWYAEVKAITIDSAIVGIDAATQKNAMDDVYPGQQNEGVGILLNSGNKYIDDSGTTHGAALSADDILMIALDLDNNDVYFGKNGQWFDGSGNADEANPNSAINLEGADHSSAFDGAYFFAWGDGGGSAAARMQWNFGNPPFTISSGNTDGKYGNFEYAPPSGYYALCTKRLAEFG